MLGLLTWHGAYLGLWTLSLCICNLPTHAFSLQKKKKGPHQNHHSPNKHPVNCSVLDTVRRQEAEERKPVHSLMPSELRTVQALRTQPAAESGKAGARSCPWGPSGHPPPPLP